MSGQEFSSLIDFLWKTTCGTEVILKTTSHQSSRSTVVTQLWGGGLRKGSKTPISLHKMKEGKEGKHGLMLVEWKYLHKGTTL